MLTIDDCNTILGKYKNGGFWYEIDFSKVDLTPGVTTKYDFCEITCVLSPDTYYYINIKIQNSLWHGMYYQKDSNGEYFLTGGLDVKSAENKVVQAMKLTGDWILGLYLTQTQYRNWDWDMHILPISPQFVCLSPLQIPIVNGEYDDKVYVEALLPDEISWYVIDNEVVTLEEDDTGKFIRLPHDNEEHIIGCESRFISNYYKTSFREFKTIPTMSIPTLYKGTSQQVQLYNEDTEEYITEFQAYYQGRKLKDNIVTLDYDVDDIVDIVIDILDPTYPPSRVKLKAPTTLYTATSQAEVETAIEQGIRTLQVVNNNTAVTLTDITLTDVLFIESKITIDESTLTNVTIIDTTYTDNGDNTLSDCTIKTSTITSTGNPSKYNDCIITECTVTATELRLTGAITNTTLSNSLIISDGIIEVIGNTFTGKNSKDYFPSFLYLTGDYLAKNNTFTLNDEWTEPAFNMCIIKSIDTFNPSLFIAENTFHLNIEYSTEEPNTFYYNIVDDDKIKAKRLS